MISREAIAELFGGANGGGRHLFAASGVMSAAIAHLTVRPFMRAVFWGVFIGALIGCSSDRVAPATTARTQQAIRPGPFEILVADLSTTDGLWRRGLFPEIDSPATAAEQQVLKQVFRRTFLGTSRVSKYHILETRRMLIGDGDPTRYTLVLVDTDLGRKIVILNYSSATLWWSQIRDA